jgi:2-polyprenyl-6-hydroxyphenyl methylase/3-demethylubiquinone-9 3-methyltransferase
MKSASPLFGKDKKKANYYKNIKMKTDTGLHEQLTEYIFNNFKRGTKILDWGCGEGALSQRLKDMGFEVLSVDMNKKDFKANTTFLQLDFNNKSDMKKFIDEYKNSFELILSVEVIEHVKSPWDYIETLATLSNHETKIIITTPNVSSWWGRFWFLFKGELWGFSEDGWNDPGHINPILDFEIKNIAREKGLKVVDFFNGGTQPVIWFYNWKRFLISIVFAPLFPFMQGIKRGWVNCYVLKKAS